MVKTGLYQHFKGKESVVIAVAKHSDTDEEFVIYKGVQDGAYHARPLASFTEKVMHDGQLVPRFTLVKEINFDLNLPK